MRSHLRYNQPKRVPGLSKDIGKVLLFMDELKYTDGEDLH